MKNLKNEKNKSAVILNPERSEWVSRSHVTGVESVVNDGAKTKRYSAKRDLYARSPNGSRLKMTEKALSFLRLRGASDVVGIEGVITRRTLVRRGYLPEQGTHANKESLFASVTWLMRLPRRIQRMLLVMTIPTLAFFLSLNISTAWAINCPAGTQGSDNVTDSNSCGANCCWGIDANHVLTITPAIDQTTNKPFESVTMKNFSRTIPGTANGYTSEYSSNAPWARQGATSVVVENGISNIGQYAFKGDTKITKVTGMENITRIGNQAFSETTSLQSIDALKVTSLGEYALSNSGLRSVDMPNVETIGYGAFMYATSLQSIDMPKVTSIGIGAFQNASLLKYAGLNPNISSDNIGVVAFSGTKVEGCGTGDNYSKCNYCTNSYVYGNSASSNISNGTTIYQPSATGNTGSCVATCADGYTASNGLCKKNPTQVAQNTTPQGGSGDTGGTSTGGDISGDFNPSDCYNKGQVPYDNQCWNEYPFARKRWTPAEAAQWLHDGNDNFVVITFKK